MSSSQKLPCERDFDPTGDDLDAQCAWRHFGGLATEEALALFRENPFYYQEDFMFMGGRAFVFYFFVLDSFLRDFRLSEQEDESQVAIIGSCVAAQFRWPTASHLGPIHPAIRSLADYVCSHTDALASDPDEQKRILEYWQSVYQALEAATS